MEISNKKYKQNYKQLLTILFGIMLILLTLSFTSAKGLNIIENSLSLNKTYGYSSTFNITIMNEESFKFFNISFDEDFISLQKFDLDRKSVV